jgi:tRNA 2-thiouridine synthesizing protein B
MLLHTVSKSPHSNNALQSCLRAALPGSCLLLLEDGVYAARRGSAFAQQINQQPNLDCYVLQPDAAARGLMEQLAPGIKLATFDDFVRLSTSCHAVQSWY